jgi:hypothetical protein
MNSALKLVAAACLFASCTLSNLSPQSRFSDSVYVLNDSARWGQVDLAAEHVADSYKDRFRARRDSWGESVQIAEVELLHMQLDSDKERALSQVSLSWTDAAGVSLRKSLVTQRWQSERGHYRLVEETISKGDPGVFGR